MTKTDIKNRWNGIKTLDDLANLLRDIRDSEFWPDLSGKALARKSGLHPITSGTLRYYAIQNPVDCERYTTFSIHKKNGKLREINTPCKELKIIQKMLNIAFAAVYEPKPCAMGFAEKRSVIMNASMHVGHNYVFNIDLENFFPSIHRSRVKGRLMGRHFRLPEEVASVIASLCCNPDSQTGHSVLPQGAPTSPLLTNAICDTLDYCMMGVAKRFGLHYSRYADDMTFSSQHKKVKGEDIYKENSTFRKEVRRIIESQQFKMNDSKTRLLNNGIRQEVTGVVVNRKPNVATKYVEDLRLLLHVWEKFGYSRAYAYFYPRYKKDKGYIKKGEPVMENVMGGKLNYLRMVKGENDSTYIHLLERYNKVLGAVWVDKLPRKNGHRPGLTYVLHYTMTEFCELMKTSVKLRTTKKHGIEGICTIDNKEKVLSVSTSTQKLLCPDADTLQPDSMVETPFLENCFVYLCQNTSKKNFWLISSTLIKVGNHIHVSREQIDQLLGIWSKKGLSAAADAFSEMLSGSEIPKEEEKKNDKSQAERGGIEPPDLTQEELSEIMKLLDNDPGVSGEDEKI